MRKLLLSILLSVALTSSLLAQDEYKFEYLVIYNYPGRGYAFENNIYGFDALLSILGQRGYKWHDVSEPRLIGLPNGSNAALVFEKATSIDKQTIRDELAKFQSEINAKIDAVADQKAKDAADKLRLQLIDALKDAKLFDGVYKQSIIDAAIVQFRKEMADGIKDLKKELTATK